MNDVLREEIEDLRLFADPFEAFRTSPNVDGWTAAFVRRGEEFAIRRDADGAISTLRGPGQPRYHSLTGLLASEAFANLRRFASAQLHVTKNLADETTGEMKEPLPNAGRIECGSGTTTTLTFNSVCDRLESRKTGLRVFVVNGAAGVGKSHLIERIVRRRAAPASYTSGAPLLLHIESRGKVLTSLSDRIAGTLSSLRAGFVEEELKPLVRRGAVQVAIDGFDELSDSRGYARAWGALRDFIRDLDGKGTCVLAGRDTMLDVDTVHQGLGNTVDRHSITLLHVEHPPGGAVRAWLSRRGKWSGRDRELELVEKQVNEIGYLGRPFFVSQIADLGPDRFQEAQGDPVADLMECIIRREGPKLTGEASDIDPELASTLYRRVLSETALMMMDDETSTVDVELVGLVIEEVFTDSADAETANALAQRAGALALLEETPGDGGKRSFPHETVRSYFFAHSVFDHSAEHRASTGLHRVPLSADDFRIFNRVARRRTPDEQGRLRESLLAGLRQANGYDHLQANVGGLLLAFAPLAEDGESGEEPLHLADLALSDVWMADLLGAQQVRLVRCDIHRLDVRGTDLRGVHFSNVFVYELTVDPFVRFGESVPKVELVISFERSEPRRIDSPSEWIEQQSARPGPLDRDGPDPDQRWYLLEKFARISMRQYAIRSGRDNDDPAAKRILRSPLWPSLRDLLESHDRLEVPGIGAAGPRSPWYHLVAGAEFLDPTSAVQDSTRKILSALNVGSE